MKRKTPIERFIDYIEFTDSCWLYKGTRSKFGHGRFYFNKKVVGAHRFSWMQYKGEIPEGIFVLHKCDVPNCVNPEHLFLGTHQDNMDDMVQKNRQRGPEADGEKNPRSKLTMTEVNEIRESYKPWSLNFDQKALAKKYGVSKSQIHNIVRNKRWNS